MAALGRITSRPFRLTYATSVAPPVLRQTDCSGVYCDWLDGSFAMTGNFDEATTLVGFS
jgi:hypothetical protein